MFDACARDVTLKIHVAAIDVCVSCVQNVSRSHPYLPFRCYLLHLRLQRVQTVCAFSSIFLRPKVMKSQKLPLLPAFQSEGAGARVLRSEAWILHHVGI